MRSWAAVRPIMVATWLGNVAPDSLFDNDLWVNLLSSPTPSCQQHILTCCRSVAPHPTVAFTEIGDCQLNTTWRWDVSDAALNFFRATRVLPECVALVPLT